MSTLNTPQKKSKVGAGAAGAGGGTLVIMLAESLDASNPAKEWLILSAPTLSVTLSAIWLWAQAGIANYFVNRKLEALAKKTKEALMEAMKNPHTSEGHRTKLQNKMEELELLLTDRQLKEIKNLEPKTSADFA